MITSGARPGIEPGNPRVGGARALRAAIGVLMLVCAGLLVWGSRILRAGELTITGGLMSLVAGRTVVYPPAHYVFFETAASRTVALQVTASCSAIFLLLPFLLLAALMISIPRIRTARLLSAAVVGTMIVFWFNQLRLLIIAWATHRWGIGTGFDWAHILAGSVVTTLSMLIALYMFFRLSLAEPGAGAKAA